MQIVFAMGVSNTHNKHMPQTKRGQQKGLAVYLAKITGPAGVEFEEECPTFSIALAALQVENNLDLQIEDNAHLRAIWLGAKHALEMQIAPFRYTAEGYTWAVALVL